MSAVDDAAEKLREAEEKRTAALRKRTAAEVQLLAAQAIYNDADYLAREARRDLQVAALITPDTTKETP